MGLETIFWPSPAWYSWGRNAILHAPAHQSLGPPGAEMGRKQRAAFSGSGEEGEGGGLVQRESHRGENFLTSRKGRGLAGPSRQRRGRLPLLSHTVIHRCLWIVEGALQPGSGSPSATPWLHRGSPRPGHPSPSPTSQGSRGGRVDESISSRGHPLRCLYPSAGLCPAGAQSSSQVLPGNPCPGGLGAQGRPSFVPSAGRGDADTYRTPRREKARSTQTSTAETLLCSSDGP